MQRPSGSTGALTLQPQRRPWLADAAFTVILSWGDLEAIRAALIRPPWPPYLGRTGFLPSRLLAGEFVEGDDLASLARGVVGPGEVARVPAVCAAPVPGDVVQMLPGRRDWRTRCHGGASLWTRISMPNEVEIEALPERDAGRLPAPDPTKMACCRCHAPPARARRLGWTR